MSAPEILWPEPESLFVGDIPPYVDVHGLLEMMAEMTDPTNTEHGNPGHPLLNGHHGLGKSLLAANLVKKVEERVGHKVPLVPFDCSEDTFELMLVGSPRVVPGGETPFIPGPFPTVIHLANQVGVCVFVAEEISALTPGAQKVFNRLTDWRDGLYVPEINQYLRIDPGCEVIIVGTMNPSGYGGVYNLNDDLRSRFDEILVPLPTQKQERDILEAICPWASRAVIEQAIQVAASSRTKATAYSLSTRDLARFLGNYYRLQKTKNGRVFALTMLANKFEGSDRNTMVDRIEAAFPGVSLPSVAV
jgi:MoxR-like ATPase